MKTEIGTYEAKTRLPELLREVRAGRRFTITSRGEAVAELIPASRRDTPDAKAAIEAFQAFRAGRPVRRRRKVNVRALIEEGRE